MIDWYLLGQHAGLVLVFLVVPKLDLDLNKEKCKLQKTDEKIAHRQRKIPYP
jgi:hypothetical protein